MAARARFPALILALCVAGCVQDDGGRWNPLSSFDKSEEDERELGFQFDREAQGRLPWIDDVPVLEFVHTLGQAVLREVGPQPFVYRFRVIRDASLNAFAVPGGFVYLHTGTILAAGSVEELAAVVGHEIAHVKARHWARMVEQSAIPNLLTSAAGVLGAIATREPGLAVTAQAVNVALQLRYSREFEGEADRLGATFVSRAGYDPEGLVRFFERLVIQRRNAPTLPPYLYSHPEVEERIETVKVLATTLRPRRAPEPQLGDALYDAQARLAHLVETRRTSWDAAPAFDRGPGDVGLSRADALEAQEDREGALAALAAAAELEPNDPRVAYRRATLLEERERLGEAARAYRRTLALDPSRALVFLRLGLVYERLGRAQDAVFYAEQAARRAAPGGDLRRRAERTVERLTFPVLSESGLADGETATSGETVAGSSRRVFSRRDPRAVWWGHLGPRWRGRHAELRVRWIDPRGDTAQEEAPRRVGRLHVTSSLALDERQDALGEWVVEVRLEGSVVDRHPFRVEP